MPEAKRVPELWATGSPSRFTLDGELPAMVKVAIQQSPVVARAATLKQPAMVNLADTARINLRTADLIPMLRNERCLDALVAVDVLMVQGIIYGAEAVANARFLDVNGRQQTFQDNRYRLMSDPAGHFYLQDTKVRPKYWMVSMWRIDVKVDTDVSTPEHRMQALKALVTANQGDLVVRERVPTDQELTSWLEALGDGIQPQRGR